MFPCTSASLGYATTIGQTRGLQPARVPRRGPSSTGRTERFAEQSGSESDVRSVACPASSTSSAVGCAAWAAKLGLTTDADGPNILLAGISAVFVTVATLGYAHHHPSPTQGDLWVIPAKRTLDGLP